MRPIEKYGWKYYGTNNELETEVFKRDVYTMNIYKDGSIHISNSNLKFNIFTFEELQAIYETAKEIKLKAEYSELEKEGISKKELLAMFAF